MFEGFILAGGRSSRMGKDKASLEIGGKTMLEIAASALRKAGASRIAVVGAQIRVEGSEAVPDIFENMGALGGIHSALAHSKLDKVFVLACDFPFITPEFVRFLAGIEPDDNTGCVVPEQPDGMLQPLAGVYSKSKCLEKCEAILSDESASHAAAAILDSAGCRIASFDEYSALGDSRRLLMNVNTPDELERARKTAEGDGV